MKVALSAALGSALLATAIAIPVIAADRDPQVAAYMTWNFGATRDYVPNAFHYGMRLDGDSQSSSLGVAPPLFMVNFSGSRVDAYLNGTNLTELALRLNQAEAAAAAGGSTALTAAAVVAGVAVVAVVASNSSGGSGSSGSTTGDTTGGNPSGGNPSGGNPSGGNPSGGNPSGRFDGGGDSHAWRVLSLGTPAPGGSEPRGIDSNYQKWLDGGTGYMGDLN